MVLKKKYFCNTMDIDSVIVELNKEIENGWHIERIEFDTKSVVLASVIIELVKREHSDMRNMFRGVSVLE